MNPSTAYDITYKPILMPFCILTCSTITLEWSQSGTCHQNFKITFSCLLKLLSQNPGFITDIRLQQYIYPIPVEFKSIFKKINLVMLYQTRRGDNVIGNLKFSNIAMSCNVHAAVGIYSYRTSNTAHVKVHTVFGTWVQIWSNSCKMIKRTVGYIPSLVESNV